MSQTLPANAAGAAEPINVLYIIDELREPGGAELILLKMVKLLPALGFKTHLVTFRLDPELAAFCELPSNLRVFPLKRTYDLGALAAAWNLRKLIRSQRIRIVHTFFETSDLWGGPVAKLSGAPILVSSRRDMGILRSGGHSLAYRFLGRMFDQTQTVSDVVRDRFIREDRLDPSKVVTIHNGVDTAKAAPTMDAARARRKFNLADASHVVVALGHVRPVKGYDVLLRAVQLAFREFPRAILAIAGQNHDAEHQRHLHALAADLGIASKVRFLGGVDDPLPLLQASDIFCLLSRSEGLSNALLEAMSARLPCVATRVGGNPEVVVEGHSGFLVASEDHVQAGERIADLLRDPPKAAAMGRAGRQIVETKFSESAMIGRLAGEYRSLVAACSS